MESIGEETAQKAAYAAARELEAIIQSSSLREVFGNPFREPRIDERWLTPEVVRLANAFYDEGGEYLFLLEQALVEAGCDDPAVLSHCRQAYGHFRGCWVVDLLLGKNSPATVR